VGIAKLSKETTVGFLAMADVSENAEVFNWQERKLKDVNNGFTFFNNGDVLVAKITPCFENGKGAFISNMKYPAGFGSTEFHVLRANQEVLLNQFLHFLVSGREFRNIGSRFMIGSAGQQRIPAQYFRNLKIALPDLKTQKQIVNKLLTIREYKRNLLVQKENLIELFYSVLSKALAGELVKDGTVTAPAKASVFPTWQAIGAVLQRLERGEMVGLGSEGHAALTMGRKFIGAELKRSYYDQAVANLRAASPGDRKQLGLFG
jgi:hypothetical protein